MEIASPVYAEAKPLGLRRGQTAQRRSSDGIPHPYGGLSLQGSASR